MRSHLSESLTLKLNVSKKNYQLEKYDLKHTNLLIVLMSLSLFLKLILAFEYWKSDPIVHMMWLVEKCSL